VQPRRATLAAKVAGATLRAELQHALADGYGLS